MNKKLKLIIFIALTSIIFNVNFVKGAFSVLPGETYTYAVEKSYWDLTDGVNSGSGTGLSNDGVSYPIGTYIGTEVLSATTTSVNYQVEIGGATATNIDDDSETWKITDLLYLPFDLSTGIGGYDQAQVERGPEYLFELFFLEPVAFDALFQNYHDTIPSQTPYTFWTFNQIGANYDTSGTIAVFDWVLNTMLNDTGCQQFFQGTYYVKIAFNTATGVLYGYRMQMDYAGECAGDTLDFVIDQKITLTSYEMGDFLYSAEPAGYQFLAILPIFFFSGLILYSKRKQKNC